VAVEGRNFALFPFEREGDLPIFARSNFDIDYRSRQTHTLRRKEEEGSLPSLLLVRARARDSPPLTHVVNFERRVSTVSFPSNQMAAASNQELAPPPSLASLVTRRSFVPYLPLSLDGESPHCERELPQRPFFPASTVVSSRGPSSATREQEKRILESILPPDLRHLVRGGSPGTIQVRPTYQSQADESSVALVLSHEGWIAYTFSARMNGVGLYPRS